MAQKAGWTFMVYLAGDNNLEDFGGKDLSEMKRVGSSPDLSIVAQFDRMSDQGTRRYHLTAGPDLDADCVDLLPETNTGDPQALADFVTWACETYPAEQYALILWNHGSGWKDDDIYRAAQARDLAGAVNRGQVRSLASGKAGRSLFSTTLEQMVVEANERAILFDDSAADFLDNQELKRVLQETAPAFGGQLNLLGFDACLMNMLEVDYQVQDSCRVVVGSQEVEPGDGWPYDAILTRLAADPAMAPEVLARTIVDAYVHFYATRQPHLGVTQSAISLPRIEPTAAAVSDLADVLAGSLSNRQTLGLLFGALRSAQSFTDRDYVDLGHLCRLLAEDDAGGQVGAAAQRVIDLLDGEETPVIAQAWHGARVQNAGGLSIYLPTRTLSPLYGDLDFAQQHRWHAFLQAFVEPH